MKISIIIPAHNEEQRIERTLRTYSTFFKERRKQIDVSLIVVLNGCTDSTARIVSIVQKEYPETIHMCVLKESGKGFAVKHGFLEALKDKTVDLIGFVDADMATEPPYFYDLITKIDSYDGIIASRYMPGATVVPRRPLIKRLGSKLVFESLIHFLFGIRYHDYQCGAKLFKRTLLEKITPYLSVQQWAFDVELLYLCKKVNAHIKELPTTWYDQAGSKLRISAGINMLCSLFLIRIKHSSLFRK